MIVWEQLGRWSKIEPSSSSGLAERRGVVRPVEDGNDHPVEKAGNERLHDLRDIDRSHCGRRRARSLRQPLQTGSVLLIVWQ